MLIMVGGRSTGRRIMGNAISKWIGFRKRYLVGKI